MPSTPGKRLNEFSLVDPQLSDHLLGYRTNGIRFTIAGLIGLTGGGGGGSVSSVFGQVGAVVRLFLIAGDGTRHEIVCLKNEETGEYELGVDQNHTPA